MVEPYIQTGAAVFVLLTVVTAFFRGWILPRAVYDEACRDKDEWRNIALGNLNLADRSVETTHRAVEAVKTGGAQ